MTLMGPPEGVLTQQLVLLEVCSDSPSLVISQGVPVLLEECVDARNAPVPRVFQILQTADCSTKDQLFAFTLDFSEDISRIENVVEFSTPFNFPKFIIHAE